MTILVPLPANFGFHRAQFINLLVELLSQTNRANIHFRKRCVSFIDRSPEEVDDGTVRDLVTMHFNDGSSSACDVLVGCDGIKSAIRGQLMRDDQAENNEAYSNNPIIHPGTRFSGTVAYRALVKPDDLRAVAGEHSAITVRKMV